MFTSKSFLQKNPVLRNKEYRVFTLIRFGISFALTMQFTVIAYWIYHITGGSKLALGFIGLAEVIPVICFSLFSGYYVDLKEKRNLLRSVLLCYSLIGAGLLYLTTNMATTHLGTSPVISLIYTAVFLGGIFRTFLGPTAFSLIALILPREQFANGISWSSMAWQVGAVLGPLTGGALIAAFGIGISMSAVLFIEVILAILINFIAQKPIMKTNREPVFKSIAEGVGFILKTPEMLGAQLLDMFSVLFGGAVALLPAVQAEFFPQTSAFFSGARAFGFLRAAPGIGALISLLIIAFIPLRNAPGKKLYTAVGGFGLCIIVFGLSRNFYLSFFVLLFSGIFDAVSVVIRSTILQLLTPDDMRGRVSSVNTMFISSSNELGDFESGVMANWLGTSRAIVVGGCLTLGIVITTLFYNPRLKNFRFKDQA